MSENRYPTRMHEVLGVEVDEEATYKSTTKELKDFRFFVDEYGSPRYPSRLLLDGYDMANIINHPERIIRKPRLTEEQVRKLKALYDFGMRWLFYGLVAGKGWMYATVEKPEYSEIGQTFIWMRERMQIKGSAICSLVEADATTPLDIVAALKANGVEVE